jgi:hypothetical protein
MATPPVQSEVGLKESFYRGFQHEVAGEIPKQTLQNITC